MEVVGEKFLRQGQEDLVIMFEGHEIHVCSLNELYSEMLGGT